MTIQLALANSHGIAMASDRHVFRGGEARSTGRDVKLFRLRGPVPAAMMTSGPLSVFETPVSRLALPVAAALAEAAGQGSPEALAEAVLGVFDRPLPGPAREEADLEVLRITTGRVLDSALAQNGPPERGLAAVLDEIASSKTCRGAAILRETCDAAWSAFAPRLQEGLPKPDHAAALRAAPDLCGRAVVGALTHDWGKPSDLFVTIGLCCPLTGVPVLVSLRLWRGLGRRLHAVSRFATDYEALWRSTRTVFVAQGSGRSVIEAMMDGIADDHWRRLGRGGQEQIEPEMEARWDRAHDRLGVASAAELGALASGLVRGAEAIGFLTRESEGTIAPVDCLLLTAEGADCTELPAGRDAAWRMVA